MLHDAAPGLLASAHDPSLVLLSLVVAFFASFAALSLAAQVSAAQENARGPFAMLGGVAMGIGIWSMHFIAMLAYRLPLRVDYDYARVFLSVAPAVFGSAVALYVVSGPAMTARQVLVGSLVMGVGVGLMHYGGMTAMDLNARLSYDPFLFVLSVVIAVVVSAVAILLCFGLRRVTGFGGFLTKVASAAAMAGGIAGLHYTAMAAARFRPFDAALAAQPPTVAAAEPGLAYSIAVGTAVVLGLALFGPALARRATEAPRSTPA
jgi:methyl-accepting chemotaxis protein PixJ